MDEKFSRRFKSFCNSLEALSELLLYDIIKCRFIQPKNVDNYFFIHRMCKKFSC